MPNYVALAWDDADLAQRESAKALLRKIRTDAAAWSISLDAPGLAVCELPLSSGRDLSQTYVLPNQKGVIFGRLFTRAYAQRSDTTQLAPAEIAFDDRCADRVISTSGRELITEYWGQYVAFLRDPESLRCWVLRDPSGVVPCHYTRIGPIWVYFLRLQDAETLAPLSGAIDHHYLLGYLMYSSVCVRETGIKDVSKLLAGECAEHSRTETKRTFYWNPLEIADRDVVEDVDTAVALTRSSVRACTHAWAACSEGIVLQLSGGLDSSIVLSCLADSPTRPPTVCVNNYTAGTSSDERAFARRAAERAGYELVENEFRALFTLDRLKDTPRALYPYPCLYDVGGAEKSIRFARARGLTTTFSGEGGDELFYRCGALPSCVDYVWRHGLRRDLLSRAFDDASLIGLSIWEVLRFAQHYGLKKHPFMIRDGAPANHRALMSAEMRHEAISDITLWHPLYQQRPEVAPLKFGHAYQFSLLAARGHIPDRLEGSLSFVTPLLSQPCMELALRIPVYVLQTGGRDRAIARRAFADQVPRQIIRRSSKGQDDTYKPAVMARNIDLIRELLLGGFLAQAGLLDLPALDKVLTRQISQIPSSCLEILTYLNVEVWARSWGATQTRAAA